jgi:hypothetical protein
MSRSIPLLLIFLIAAPALAQQTRPVERSAAPQNDRLIMEALQGLGVSPDGAAIGLSIPRAFAALYPQELYHAYRLTPIQARAVAYVTMLMATDLPPVPRRDREVVQPPPPGGGPCHEVHEAVYDLAGAVPASGSLFLSGAEKEALQRHGPEIRRMAMACGMYDIADASLELAGYATESMPSRSDVTDVLAELRRLLAAYR